MMFTPAMEAEALDTRRLRAMNTIAAALSDSVDLDSVLDQAVSSLLELTGLNSGVVYLLDDRSDQLVGRSAFGFRYGLTPGIDVHSIASGSFPSRAFRSMDPIVFDVADPRNGYSSITDEERRCIIPEGIRTAVAARLESSSRAYGVIAICSHESRIDYTAEDLSFVKTICGQVAVAIERANLYEQLRSTATEASTLYEIGRLLGSSLEPTESLGAVAKIMREGFDIEAVRIQVNEPPSSAISVSNVSSPAAGKETPTVRLPCEVGNVTLGVAEIWGTSVTPKKLYSLARAADLIATSIWNQHLYLESKRFGALEERNRLAREIHDGLSQKLYSIQLGVAALLSGLPTQGTEGSLAEGLRSIEKLAQSGLDDARRSVLELRCASADYPTLSRAAQEVVADFERDSGLSCKVVLRGSELTVSMERQNALIRSLQELLHNVHKHAHASQVMVEITFDANSVEVSVVDDGHGFDLLLDDIALSGGRYGLIGVLERVEAFGGALEAEYEQTGRMRVSVSIPS